MDILRHPYAGPTHWRSGQGGWVRPWHFGKSGLGPGVLPLMALFISSVISIFECMAKTGYDNEFKVMIVDLIKIWFNGKTGL